MSSDVHPPIGSRRLISALLGLAAAVWLLHWAANFPAVMTPDSVEQWGQALSGRYTDWHPVAHTLLIKASLLLTASPVAVILMQIGLMLVVAAATLACAQRRGASPGLLLLLGLFFALPPVHGAMLSTLWKDIPFAAAFAGLTLCLVRLSARPRATASRQDYVLLVVTGISVTLLRHNGLGCALAGIAALAIAQPAQRKPLAACLAVVGLAAFGWKFWLSHGLQTPASPLTELLAQPLQQTATIAAADSSAVTVAQRAQLASVLPWPAWLAHDNRQSVDDLKFNAAFNPAPIAAAPGVYLTLWLDLVRARPRLAARAALGQSGVIWNPAFSARDTYPSGIAPNPYGLQPAPLCPGLASAIHQLYLAAAQRPWIWLMRPAVVTLVLLAAAVWSAGRAGWTGLAPFAPWAANTAAFTVLVPTPDFRYFYPALVALPALLLHAWSLRPAHSRPTSP